MLARTDCAGLLFSGFARLVSVYLDPGMPVNEELVRVASNYATLRTWSPFAMMCLLIIFSWWNERSRVAN